MYHLYIKTTKPFTSKKLIGEFSDIDETYERLAVEQEKDPDIKFVIEETTGRVDVYGELIVDLIEEN